jgi:hypothetical protein
MIPSTSYFNSKTEPLALGESTYLSNLAAANGDLNYILVNNNLGINMLETIMPSFFLYFGGGIEFMLGHSYYEYNDGLSDQTIMSGYIGIGFFQSIGVYYEFTDNIALNVGLNTSYDLWIYNYQKSSADSSLNKFDKLDAKGNNYIGRVMLTYNF